MKPIQQINAELDADLREWFGTTLSPFQLTDEQHSQLWGFYIAEKTEAEKLIEVESMPEGLQESAMALLGYEREQ